MLVLGIDPGYAASGVALLDVQRGKPPRLLRVATTRTDPKLSAAARWDALWLRWSEVAGHDPGDELPAIVAVEDQRQAWLGHARRGTTNAAALACIEAVGLARGLAASLGARCIVVSPQAAKLAAVGRGGGRASKAQVRRALRARLPTLIEGASEHACDAIAIALAGLAASRVAT